MALNAAALTADATSMASLLAYMAIFTDDPGSGGSNESTASRVAAGWTVSANVLTATGKAFSGGAASGPAKYVGFFSAGTGGTFYGSYALTGDQAFNASGAYTVASVSITGASS